MLSDLPFSWRQSEQEVLTYRDMVISYILPMVSEPAYVCKRELVQLITVMARLDYLRLEGGETLFKFVVRMASITQAELDKCAEEAAKVCPFHEFVCLFCSCV